MTIEYHIHTEQNDDYEQAYVFVVDRLESGRVDIKDMYTIVIVEGKEIRTRVRLNNLFHTIVENVGGNIDKTDATQIFNIFGNLFSEETKEQHDLEVLAEEFDRLEATSLINASIVAINEHKSPIDNNGYINANNIPK